MGIITIELGDGYVAVSPTIPEKLYKQLYYWHRELVFDQATYRRVATGTRKNLYSVQTTVNADGSINEKLVTMPGFCSRIKRVVAEAGYDMQFVDRRTPAPTPHYLEALEGLREYQQDPVLVALQSGGGIIAMPTGTGKTHCLAALLRAYPHAELCARNTPLAVVATPEQDITRKDYNDLCRILPGRDIGLVMSGNKKFSDDIQVITLQSLPLLDPNDIGILIVDEVHTAASEHRAEIITSARRALKWGVSATPDGRFDGRDKVTEGLFGPIVYQSTYADGVKCGALVPITVCWLKCPEPSEGIHHFLNRKTRDGRYRGGVWRNDAQHQLIREVMQKVGPAHQVLCIMQFMHQMNALAALLPDVAIVHAEVSKDDVAAKHKNLVAVSRAERKSIYQRMETGELRKVMSTHVYKQGVNFPKLDVVINAGGGGSDIVAAQIPGRESRLVAGKGRSYLVDFQHPWDVVLDKANDKMKPGPILDDDKSRQRCYQELEFEQVWFDSVDDLPFLKEPDGPSRT